MPGVTLSTSPALARHQACASVRLSVDLWAEGWEARHCVPCALCELRGLVALPSLCWLTQPASETVTFRQSKTEGATTGLHSLETSLFPHAG